MHVGFAEWSLILLCLASACSIGGGLYEHIVLTPLWSASPPTSFAVMRVWSGVYFIREMLAFQKVPLDAPPSAELSARVARWTFWSWFREPLDLIAFVSFLLAVRS